MSSILLLGDTSGSITVAAPAVAGSGTLTLPTGTATLGIAGPAFSAYCTTSQSLANNTLAVMQCNTEDFDSNNLYNNSTYTFTPNIAGYYQFNATASFSPNGSGECYAYIFKNSSGYLLFDITPSQFWALGGSVLLYANGTTDYFQFKFIQGTGTSKTMDASTKFSGFLVRAA